jgi:hypothetical protein
MDAIDRYGESLVRAAGRRSRVARLPTPGALPHRGRWSAATAAAVALLLTAAAWAAGIIPLGEVVGPSHTPSPVADEGAPAVGTSRLLGLRVADPAGGPPWGMRIVRTTRGFNCVQLGRVADGTIGVLGQDDAFGNDGRFHPLAANLFSPTGCSLADANGLSFVNVSLPAVSASGLTASESASPLGCATVEQAHPVLPACPEEDLRTIYYGLLGPDARSITYRVAGAAPRHLAVAPPYGAYLIVLPGSLAGHGESVGPGLTRANTVIEAITYRGGHTCHVVETEPLKEACQPVGYVAQPSPEPSATQLATSVHAHALPGREHGEIQFEIGFTSRVAIHNGRAFYEAELRYAHSPSCHAQGGDAATDANIARGQHVIIRFPASTDCPGLARGRVEYVGSNGSAGVSAVVGLAGRSAPLLVGRFAVHIP